jgi:hypothetical protein
VKRWSNTNRTPGLAGDESGGFWGFGLDPHRVQRPCETGLNQSNWNRPETGLFGRGSIQMHVDAVRRNYDKVRWTKGRLQASDLVNVCVRAGMWKSRKDHQ